MAADPIIYCLEQLTDYDQFERLCSDMMALDGYRGIEPLGGSKDKGRDAVHVGRASNHTVTIFAYSVREDWRKKLEEDSVKIRKHKHVCQRLVFLCTSAFTPYERDDAVNFIRTTYGWELELYGLERLRVMLNTTHKELIAKHPQIFCPPFFPVAGGLSLAFSRDHIVIDHADEDSALAHWLARRLTLVGYHVWCRGLAPLAGSSVKETVRGLLNNRAFRYICILSPTALTDPDFTSRRNLAQAIGTNLILPALANAIDTNVLDQETRAIEPARFDLDWSIGLLTVERVLESTKCPRELEGARELAIRSYLPPDILLPQPELLASNLFRVIRVPEVITRFQSKKPLIQEMDSQKEDGKQQTCENSILLWAFRSVGLTNKQFLSFHKPPRQLARKFGIVEKGGAVWNATKEIDGAPVEDLVKELIKKTLYAECLRRGLCYCPDREIVYFPFNLLRNDRLPFCKLDGSSTFFLVAGERTHGKGDRARKYKYHLAPIFVPKEHHAGGYEIIVRIRLRLTDKDGKLLLGRTSNSRRKKICKSWWNDEWLARTMGVVQFLTNGQKQIEIGNASDESIIINPFPRTWNSPVSLNEESFADAIKIREEEEDHMRDNEEVDEDE